MKSKKLVALMTAVSILATTGVAMVSMSGCGAKTEAVYAYYAYQNHADAANPVQYAYKLEVMSDGTYVMNYETMWGIPFVTLVYGRDITSYGKLTDVTTADAEEGVKVYKLEMPTRMVLIAEERSAITVNVDTDNWPAGDVENDIPAGITYTLNARAETEIWETAEDFIAAYGREYTVTCDTTTGSMTVEVVGTQIPADGAVVVG